MTKVYKTINSSPTVLAKGDEIVELMLQEFPKLQTSSHPSIWVSLKKFVLMKFTVFPPNFGLRYSIESNKGAPIDKGFKRLLQSSSIESITNRC